MFFVKLSLLNRRGTWFPARFEIAAEQSSGLIRKWRIGYHEWPLRRLPRASLEETWRKVELWHDRPGASGQTRFGLLTPKAVALSFYECDVPSGIITAAAVETLVRVRS